MDSRGWGASKKRTNLYELKLKQSDYVIFIFSLLMLILVILMYVNNIKIPKIINLLYI